MTSARRRVAAERGARGRAWKPAQRAKRLWVLTALLFNFVVIGWVSLPLLRNPQLDSDDYRYLSRVQALEGRFWDGFVEASIVENRWDHLWWMDATQKVRFFRPTVILTYWLDSKLYRKDLLRGLQWTNVVLHLVCSLLVLLVLLHWLGPGLPALLGSLLFAGFWAHGEVLWYIAGRTDTLAAAGYLGCLGLHLKGSRRGMLRWCAVPCYAFALISKELAIALPVVLFLHDLGVEKRAVSVKKLVVQEWRLYASYLLVAVAVQVLRAAVLAGEESQLMHPYFVPPNHAEFPAHLWSQIRNYAENLLFARTTKPFMRPDELADYSSAMGFWGTLWVGLVFLVTLRRDRRFLVLVALALTTWLPTSFVYISERYVYLPSVAVAGSLALLLHHCRTRPVLSKLALVLAVVWVGHQASRLQRKNTYFALQSQRQPEYMGEQIKRISPLIDPHDKLLLLNLPGAWLHAQFTEEQLRVQLGAPELSVRVLSMMPEDPEMGSGLRIEPQGTSSVDVQSARRGSAKHSPVLLAGADAFAWVDLHAGTQVQREELGFHAEILEGDGKRCDAVRFTFPDPLEEYKLLLWEAHPARQLPVQERYRRAQVRIVPIR